MARLDLDGRQAADAHVRRPLLPGERLDLLQDLTGSRGDGCDEARATGPSTATTAHSEVSIETIRRFPMGDSRRLADRQTIVPFSLAEIPWRSQLLAGAGPRRPSRRHAVSEPEMG